MSNMVQPRGAAAEDDGERDAAVTDGDLASLVRRWAAARSRAQDRVRRESALFVAPEPDPVDAPAGAAADVPAAVDPAETVAGTEVEGVVEPPTARTELPDRTEPEPDPVLRADEDLPPLLSPRQPALPHRPTATESEHATRLAVLIDARRVSEDAASGLLARLGERGVVNVCRAYADWSRAELGPWVGRLRRQGLHSFHQFADDDDQALVAMAIDAVDLARDAAIDEMVIAGDLTSMLPLVHRLHAADVRVVLVGPSHTPHDVRAACDEFLEADSVGREEQVPTGRHRA